jgi:hypothetical protein
MDVLFYGLNRSASFSWPSIRRSVLVPLRRYATEKSIDLNVYVLLSRTRNVIDLPRSSEYGNSEWDFNFSEEITNLIYLEQDELIHLSDKTFQIAKEFGDPWPESNFQSLRNLLVTLELLDQSCALFPLGRSQLFVSRIDLTYHDQILLSDLSGDSKFPSYNKFGGLNDRFSWLAREDVSIYLQRKARQLEFMQTRGPLHAERFLKFCFEGRNYTENLNARASRTRLGGRIHPEDFKI